MIHTSFKVMKKHTLDLVRGLSKPTTVTFDVIVWMNLGCDKSKLGWPERRLVTVNRVLTIWFGSVFIGLTYH